MNNILLLLLSILLLKAGVSFFHLFNPCSPCCPTSGSGSGSGSGAGSGGSSLIPTGCCSLPETITATYANGSGQCASIDGQSITLTYDAGYSAAVGAPSWLSPAYYSGSFFTQGPGVPAQGDSNCNWYVLFQCVNTGFGYAWQAIAQLYAVNREGSCSPGFENLAGNEQFTPNCSDPLSVALPLSTPGSGFTLNCCGCTFGSNFAFMNFTE